MKNILQNRKGFIARGGFAVGLIIILTIAMLIDLANGNSEAAGQWFLGIIVPSVILTIIVIAWNSIKK